MSNRALTAWLGLPDGTRRNIFEETAKQIGLPAAAVEKDWWVQQAIRLVFETSIAPHIVFKGGTSLSKAWGLIDRFSEDIDLALDRRFLGFERPDAEMTGSQISKLRKHAFTFINDKFLPELAEKFYTANLQVSIEIIDVSANDNDPLKIAVFYPEVTVPVPYLQSRVIIEVGSRSLIEPYELRSFASFVDEKFVGRPFADHPITVPTVTPDRTFLEKVFLLHEEFQLPQNRMKVDRKSRHLYDLEKLMNTEYAARALSNKELYQTIVMHRKFITPVRGVDYSKHAPEGINPVPPDTMMSAWEEDYKAMQVSMFYNPSLHFSELISRINVLKATINAIRH